jgi:hypothetical protein
VEPDVASTLTLRYAKWTRKIALNAGWDLEILPDAGTADIRA